MKKEIKNKRDNQKQDKSLKNGESKVYRNLIYKEKEKKILIL
jgi:hypothetical protein